MRPGFEAGAAFIERAFVAFVRDARAWRLRERERRQQRLDAEFAARNAPSSVSSLVASTTSLHGRPQGESAGRGATRGASAEHTGARAAATTSSAILVHCVARLDIGKGFPAQSPGCSFCFYCAPVFVRPACTAPQCAFAGGCPGTGAGRCKKPGTPCDGDVTRGAAGTASHSAVPLLRGGSVHGLRPHAVSLRRPGHPRQCGRCPTQALDSPGNGSMVLYWAHLATLPVARRGGQLTGVWMGVPRSGLAAPGARHLRRVKNSVGNVASPRRSVCVPNEGPVEKVLSSMRRRWQPWKRHAWAKAKDINHWLMHDGSPVKFHLYYVP